MKCPEGIACLQCPHYRKDCTIFPGNKKEAKRESSPETSKKERIIAL